MSEHEGSEGKSVGAFLLGFLTGVLVCIGVGGGLFVVRGRVAMDEARMMEMRAREAEAVARMEAERAAAEAADGALEKDRKPRRRCANAEKRPRRRGG